MSDFIVASQHLCRSKVVSIAFLLLAFACKKKEDLPSPPPDPSGSRTALTLDSIFLYAKELYLWNTQLPDRQTFVPGKYLQTSAREIDQLKQELFDLSQYAINPLTRQPYERHPLQPDMPKYSTLLDYLAPATPSVQETSLSGAGASFGLALVATGTNDIRVQYVLRGSAAADAQLRRGLRITKVNNAAVTTTDSYYAFVQTAFENSAVELKVLNEQGQEQLITLYQGNYIANPIHQDTVFRLGTHRIGYFSYHYFSPESNTRASFRPVLQRFMSAQVTDLIIDLRYNSGGYLNTCKYLANVLAPAPADRRVMFSEHYNQQMQLGTAPLLAKQTILDGNGQPVMLGDRPATLADIDFSVEQNTTFFDQEPGVHDLKRVYFIVSQQTASAAELLINSLKPYMDVQLIGVSADGNGQVRTYGKPVGFFDIRIDRYKVYLSMFHDKNANNEGDYFDGMPAALTRRDDARYNFGDLRDPALRAAVDLIAPGAAIRTAGSERLQQSTAGTFQAKAITPAVPVVSGLIKDNWKFIK